MKLELTNAELEWLTRWVGRAGQEELVFSVPVYEKLRTKLKLLDEIKDLRGKLSKLEAQFT